MKKELRHNLIVAYVVFTMVSFVTGFIGYKTKHLDVGSVVLLCIFLVLATTLYTWLVVREERTTSDRILEVQADFEEFNLRVLKGKSGVYAVATGEALSTIIVTEELSLEELETFRDGVFQGLLMAYEDMSEPEKPSLANINTSKGDTDIDTWLARQEELDREASTHALDCRCARCEPQEWYGVI